MNPERPLLINKLILGVLSLILVCLVLLVIRAYERSPSPTQPDLAATEEPRVEEAPAPASAAAEPEMAPVPSPPIVRRAPVINRPRVVVASPPQSPNAPAEAPVELPIEPTPGVPVVNIPGGVALGTGNRSQGAGAPGSGGEVTGVVSLMGTPPPEVPIDFGPLCGRLQPAPVTTRRFVVNGEGRLADVFVYLSRGAPSHQQDSMEPAVFLDQRGCLFENVVVGLMITQKLLVRNLDPELHNVHLIPKENRESNRAQPAGAPPIALSFSKPELFMKLKCDVHPWMFAYISAMNHPYFAVTDSDGVFRIPSGLPAGRYVVTAVHLKAGTLSQEISLRGDERRSVEFQFAVPGAIAPQSQASARD